MTDSIITYNGIAYRLIDYPTLCEQHSRGYINNVCWQAPAIVDGDKPDELGMIPAYEISWADVDLTEEQIEWDVSSADLVDWETPDNVESHGGYDTKTGRIC